MDEKYGSFNRKGGGLNQEFSHLLLEPTGQWIQLNLKEIPTYPLMETSSQFIEAELRLNHEEENQKNRLAPEEHQGLSSTSESY